MDTDFNVDKLCLQTKRALSGAEVTSVPALALSCLWPDLMLLFEKHNKNCHSGKEADKAWLYAV